MSCIQHNCTNGPYTVQFWKLLQADSLNAATQNHWIGQRVASCLQELPPLGNEDFLSWRDIYFRALVEQSIREERFPDSTPLDVVISSVTSCEPLIRWQKDQMKWAAAQGASRRRVRIETIPLAYPLDEAYPPLIEFSKKLQECGQSYIGQGYTFAGDMDVAFTIHPNGKVRLVPGKTTYPAAAYVRPYLNCVNTAFGKLVFPSPVNHQSVSLTAAIQIFPVNPTPASIPDSSIRSQREWFRCQTAGECVIIEGNCGVEWAVNKRFAQVSRKNPPRRDGPCLKPLESHPSATFAICVEGRCELYPAGSYAGGTSISDDACMILHAGDMPVVTT